jgi:hypothetical protein
VFVASTELQKQEGLRLFESENKSVPAISYRFQHISPAVTLCIGGGGGSSSSSSSSSNSSSSNTSKLATSALRVISFSNRLMQGGKY